MRCLLRLALAHSTTWNERVSVAGLTPVDPTAGKRRPQDGRIGTARRRFFYSPGIDNFDIAPEKSVPLAKSKSLEFRIEAFNVFNHAQFYGPAAVNSDVNSAKLRTGGQRSVSPAPSVGRQV